MSRYPVIRNFSYCLAHVPDLVRYGSKPRREIAADGAVGSKMAAFLRSFAEAVRYPPNQTFIGNITPQELAAIPRPWFQVPAGDDRAAMKRQGRFGEIIDQQTFYALLKLADVLNPPLFETDKTVLDELRKRLAEHPLFTAQARESFQAAPSRDPGTGALPAAVLPLYAGGRVYGYFHRDERAEGRDDENLAAHDLLENLSTKASGALALKWLLHREGIGAEQVDYLISCGEEACGDRYQRGGGGMAKAIGEMCGCTNAAGVDLKNFCAAPASALIVAASLVQAGVFRQVVVVGGGSLAKLGMKFQSFMQHEMPILDDCLAAMAFLVTPDDGVSPVIRLESGAVGKVPVGASTSDESVFRHYLLEPLEKLGLRLTDIDRYAAELQNPEITEFAGSGDVAKKNFRKIAAMAVLAEQLDKSAMDGWLQKIAMPGFAPTQGHIPSAVPYLGHGITAMRKGEIRRAMFLSRASLFLNRCTNLLDGVSFILERNPHSQEGAGSAST